MTRQDMTIEDQFLLYAYEFEQQYNRQCSIDVLAFLFDMPLAEAKSIVRSLVDKGYVNCAGATGE